MLIALINKINLSIWDLAVIRLKWECHLNPQKWKITFLQKKQKKKAGLLTVTDSAWNTRELEV